MTNQLLKCQISEIFRANQEAPKSTTCWKWIEKAFIRTAKKINSKYKRPRSITIIIYPSDFHYEIFVGSEDKPIEEGHFRFSRKSLDVCEGIAHYNLIQVEGGLEYFEDEFYFIYEV